MVAYLALRQVLPQQTLERIRHLSRRTAISDWPRCSLVQTKRSAQAEVVGVDHAVLNFDLLAFNANIGDPVLSATVGASGDVQFQMLIETRQTFFQFLHQPAREALGFGDSQLAEFRPAARHRAAPECPDQPDPAETRGQTAVLVPGERRRAGVDEGGRNAPVRRRRSLRSEEHTSELQSL